MTGQNAHRGRILVVSQFLPVTLSVPDNSAPLPPFPQSPKFTRRSESLISTAPPSKYHFRSDSDMERTPYQPSSILSSSFSGVMQLSPLEPPEIPVCPAVTEWSIEPSAMGNVGLHNAVKAMRAGDERPVVWVGQLGKSTDCLDDQVKAELTETLLRDHSAIPVYVSDDEARGHYTQFCKETLWPTFHYILPEYLKTSTTEKKSWKNYVAVNEHCARTIADNLQDDDLVWIHCYHLMLVPSMLRKLKPGAKIGFFLHIPFPSDEIFRCLHVRHELLEGLMGASLLGFQTYSFARHFLHTCTKILGVKTTPTGIQRDNSCLPVGIFPIGIDTPTLNIKRQEQEVKDMIAMLREKYHDKKVIVGRDKLDPVKGVRQKFLAFEIFLSTYPEWQGKVVLVQVASSTTEHLALQTQVSDLVSRINSKFGSIEYTPVVYLQQDISHSHYLALLTIADACLITSLRDGMNLTSHEYVACQEEHHNPLIISEFTGTYGSFGSAIRINPWDYDEIACAINEALTMSEERRSQTHRELYRHVISNTGSYWATRFLNILTESTAEQPAPVQV
eukprot:Partr_v1_DN26770_c3_g1_i4_m8369 putative synthase